MDPRTAAHAMAWLRAGQIGPDPSLPEDPEKDVRARQVRACFSEFPEVLETLLQMTLFRAPVDHRLQGGEYRNHAQARLGQNQVAAAVLAYIDHAEQLDRRPSNAASHLRPDDPPASGGSWDPAFGPDGATSDPSIALR